MDTDDAHSAVLSRSMFLTFAGAAVAALEEWAWNSSGTAADCAPATSTVAAIKPAMDIAKIAFCIWISPRTQHLLASKATAVARLVHSRIADRRPQ
jgi:hypothetical protein